MRSWRREDRERPIGAKWRRRTEDVDDTNRRDDRCRRDLHARWLKPLDEEVPRRVRWRDARHACGMIEGHGAIVDQAAETCEAAVLRRRACEIQLGVALIVAEPAFALTMLSTMPAAWRR
jgi:hypothetical protein